MRKKQGFTAEDVLLILFCDKELDEFCDKEVENEISRSICQ